MQVSARVLHPRLPVTGFLKGYKQEEGRPILKSLETPVGRTESLSLHLYQGGAKKLEASTFQPPLPTASSKGPGFASFRRGAIAVR
jgi:hypothetical protein